MNEKVRVKDGSMQLKIGGLLGVIFGLLSMLSIGFLQSSTGAALLSADVLAYYNEPHMIFSSYWFAILEIVFGTFAFYFAQHPEKNSLCLCFAAGFSLCYVFSVMQTIATPTYLEKIVSYIFIVVPMIYTYGAYKQREYYSKANNS